MMRLLWTFVALTSSLASASYQEYAQSSAPVVLTQSTVSEGVMGHSPEAPAVPMVSTEIPVVPAPSADPGAGVYVGTVPTPVVAIPAPSVLAPSVDPGAGVYVGTMPTPVVAIPAPSMPVPSALSPVAPAVPAINSQAVEQELVMLEFVPISVQPTVAVDPIPSDVKAVDETSEESEPCSEETAQVVPRPLIPAPPRPAFTGTMPLLASKPAPSAPAAPAEPSADSSIEGSAEVASATPCPEEESQYHPVPAPSAPEPSAPAPSAPEPSAPAPSYTAPPAPSVPAPSAPEPSAPEPSAPAPSYTAPPAPSVPAPSAPEPSAPAPSAPEPLAPEPSSIEGSAESAPATPCASEATEASKPMPEVPAAETPVAPSVLDTVTQPKDAEYTTTVYIDITTNVVVSEIWTATSIKKPEMPIEVSVMTSSTSVEASAETKSLEAVQPTSTQALPSTSELCVPMVTTATVYLPVFMPLATEAWPNYSAVLPFAPGPVIWTTTTSSAKPGPTGLLTIIPAVPSQSSEPCSLQSSITPIFP